MTHIYALQGAEPRKRDVINDLFKMLRTLYPDASIKKSFEDATITATIQCKTGLKIGIESEDEIDYLKKSLHSFREEKCDVIFCACPEWGKTTEAIQELEDDSCIVHFIGLKPKKRFVQNNTSDKVIYDPQAHELRILAGV